MYAIGMRRRECVLNGLFLCVLIDLNSVDYCRAFLREHQAEKTRAASNVKDIFRCNFAAGNFVCDPCTEQTCVRAHFHGAFVLTNGELFEAEHWSVNWELVIWNLVEFFRLEIDLFRVNVLKEQHPNLRSRPRDIYNTR